MIRIDQASINGFKNAMSQFFPHFLDTDMDLPKEFSFDVGLGDILWELFTWHVSWSDIEFTDVKLDIPSIRVDL